MSVITRGLCIIRGWFAGGKIGTNGTIPNNDLPTISNKDIQVWRKNGNHNHKIHRDNDLPAVIDADGTQKWYCDGELHREGDLPAIIYADGDQFWIQYGKIHRDNDNTRGSDLPAIILANGDQFWYQHGKLHRENDLPAIMCANGDQYWYQNGEPQPRPSRHYSRQ